jgi:hypothetical protein
MRKLLDETFEKTIEAANKEADWYNRKKSAKSTWSKIIRFSSIILIGLGGIFPLVSKIGSFEHVSDWGYVCIALAGTLLFLDRFFGFSSGWVRYITTEFEIRKQVKDFEMRWKIEMSRLDLCEEQLTCDKMIQMLTMLKDFSAAIDELIRQETNTWATEFQNNISELQKIASAKMEEFRPGFIKVIVKNKTAYKDILIKVDGIDRKVLVGAEALIDNITPGPHTVIAEGEKTGGEKIAATTIVSVEANKIVTAELIMP